MPRTVDDGALCRYVLESEWFRQAMTIMAYAAIPPEVDLSPVLEAILAAGKTLIMPRCEADGMMTARRIDDLGQLTSGTYGIPEPNSDAPVVSAAEIDLILVPGMAFDASGRRLGRGKGYYDRFLQGKEILKIGVAFSCQQAEKLTAKATDVKMDRIITENGILKCKGVYL